MTLVTWLLRTTVACKCSLWEQINEDEKMNSVIFDFGRDILQSLVLCKALISANLVSPLQRQVLQIVPSVCDFKMEGEKPPRQIPDGTGLMS